MINSTSSIPNENTVTRLILYQQEGEKGREEEKGEHTVCFKRIASGGLSNV